MKFALHSVNLEVHVAVYLAKLFRQPGPRLGDTENPFLSTAKNIPPVIYLEPDV